MLQIPMKTTGALTRESITSLNTKKVEKPLSFRDLQTKHTNSQESFTPVRPEPITQSHAQSEPVKQANIEKPTPDFVHLVQKGQRISLPLSNSKCKLKVALGWNVQNPDCDLDVSAFLLDQTGKVIGDSWFVFYGQTQSPDSSTIFSGEDSTARESITVDLSRLNTSVSKIVFVLTINEALEKHLNFSMVKDAYIQLFDATNHEELVGFPLTDYYSNVTSMMLGELYLHNQIWKFHAIGDGVARDLAGLCELYGVQVI